MYISICILVDIVLLQFWQFYCTGVYWKWWKKGDKVNVPKRKQFHEVCANAPGSVRTIIKSRYSIPAWNSIHPRLTRAFSLYRNSKNLMPQSIDVRRTHARARKARRLLSRSGIAFWANYRAYFFSLSRGRFTTAAECLGKSFNIEYLHIGDIFIGRV